MFPGVLLALALLGKVAEARLPESVPDFVVAPYVQLGDHPRQTRPDYLVVAWETPDQTAEWRVEWIPGSGPSTRQDVWRGVHAQGAQRTGLGTPSFRAWTATLDGLQPGSTYRYRLRKNGRLVWESYVRSRPLASQAQRFVLFGDAACGSQGQRGIAGLAEHLDPDYAILAGDVVYPYGQIKDYRERLFGIFNAPLNSLATGAPLMRHVPFFTVPGNHDLGTRTFTEVRNLEAHPDVLAYFYEWLQPLNGPKGEAASRLAAPLEGAPHSRQAFLRAAGERYPRMGFYSFDYGCVHWTMLDSNNYVDLGSPALLRWLEDDLRRARSFAWRCVVVHHPPFHSSRQHAKDQQMRLLSPLFERWGVDVVFGGHVHAYERTRPLRFRPQARALTGSRMQPQADGTVPGSFALDTSFDGIRQTRPKGVVYITSGAGGAHLYDPDLTTARTAWQAYTARYAAHTHSLTVCEATPVALHLRQVAVHGEVLDAITLTRPGKGQARLHTPKACSPRQEPGL